MYLLSTNITSPLGLTTLDNYHAVSAGNSALKHHEAGTRGVPFPFEAALFSDRQWQEILLPGMTHFESLVVRSAQEALSHTDIDTASQRTLFILSTTKGDILTPPGETARHIAHAIGVTTEPIVVCNACISGVAAQILAQRLVDSGYCDNAIVSGADVQGEFIISGFQALQALSDEPCRPFDAERLGLNLGEAAATMVYTADSTTHTAHDAWHLVAGAIRNDAFHISGPHPKGEGCMRALTQVIGNKDDLGVIGVHGTATMYNDQMESKAIDRAGLSDIPLSALKGYYGHTMGAAGLLETIITATALDDGGTILPSRGYSERGVSGKVNISGQAMHTEKREFVKMLSGFGGCNGAIRMSKLRADEHNATEPTGGTDSTTTVHTSSNHNDIIRTEDLSDKTAEQLTEMYREAGVSYPKFHKMDILSRRAFIATERLQREHRLTQEEADETAVIFFNSTSSIVADRAYLDTITDKEAYYPSPALFVHTLPNISTGEVAMRNGIHGETSFYILPQPNEALQQAIVNATLQYDSGIRRIITGWID